MKKGDCDFLFSGNTMACEWIANQPVLLLSRAIEKMNDILSVQRRKKGSKTKSCLRLSSFKIVTLVELILWISVLPHIVWNENHLLDFISAFSLTWWISYVNSYLIYNMKHRSKLYLLDYKIVVAKNLIQYIQDWKRAVFPLSKRKNQPESIDNHGGHLPDYQTTRKRCAYCVKKWRVKK